MSAVETSSTQVRTARSSSRIDALDWAKGALVICMVVYHAINYSAFRPLAFQYMGFLPPAFILIAGFLVGQVYASKYDLESWRPYARLALRGLKVLGLFTLLNLAYCVGARRGLQEGWAEFVARAGSIFLSGNNRAGIFEVLLPIAYFLLLAPGLLWLRSRAKASIGIGAAVVCAVCLVLERTGNPVQNLSFVSVGILGMALGLVPMSLVNQLARRWAVVAMLCVIYRLASRWLGESYWVQTYGAAAGVLLFYCLGVHLNCTSWHARQFVIFGQYSLLGYLGQIAILQLVVGVAGGKPQHWPGVVAVGVVTTALTLALIRLVDALRSRNVAANSLYKAIFA